jgi:hypothetical protein
MRFSPDARITAEFVGTAFLLMDVVGSGTEPTSPTAEALFASKNSGKFYAETVVILLYFCFLQHSC